MMRDVLNKSEVGCKSFDYKSRQMFTFQLQKHIYIDKTEKKKIQNQTCTIRATPTIYRVFLILNGVELMLTLALSEGILTNLVSIDSSKLGIYDYNKFCP